MPLFSETLNKEVSNVLCGKPNILAELLLGLSIVVIQDSEDGKRTLFKKMREENSELLQSVRRATGAIGG